MTVDALILERIPLFYSVLNFNKFLVWVLTLDMLESGIKHNNTLEISGFLAHHRNL